MSLSGHFLRNKYTSCLILGLIPFTTHIFCLGLGFCFKLFLVNTHSLSCYNTLSDHHTLPVLVITYALCLVCFMALLAATHFLSHFRTFSTHYTFFLSRFRHLGRNYIAFFWSSHTSCLILGLFLVTTLSSCLVSGLFPWCSLCFPSEVKSLISSPPHWWRQCCRSLLQIYRKCLSVFVSLNNKTRLKV